MRTVIRSGLTPAHPFPILLIGHTLSKIGDGLHEPIFVIAVLKATNNAMAPTAAIYFLRFLPFLIVGPLGAALADRIPAKRLMLLADLVRMLLTAIFSTLLIADQVGTVALALFGMSMTAMRTLFQPAFQAVIPLLVAPERLSRANGATQIAHELGGLLGPALGGALLALTWRSGAVLLLDSATYLLSAVCLLAIHIPPPHGAAPQPGPTGGLRLRDLYKQFGHNLTQLTRHPQLLVTIAYSSACILFAGAALRMLIPAMIKQSAGPDSMIGYAMSLSAWGTIVGVMLYGRLARAISAASLMAYWAIYGMALALLPLCVSNPTALLSGVSSSAWRVRLST
jgi:DHA3 family macrolide efflux protein-like MFS transporter